jgi:small-conductance mechanosensitive channel
MPEELVWQHWAMGIVLVAGAALAGTIVHTVGFAVAHRVARRSGNPLADRLVTYAQNPSRLIMPMLAVQLVLPRLEQLAGETEAAPVVSLLHHVLTLVLIAGIAWLAISMMHIVDDFVGSKYRVDVRDNLSARRIHTQARVLRQSVTVLVVIVAASAMLMTFPQVRQLGASLLASAGLAGIVVGFASRPVLQNLIAGVQIAITQPIRVDDVLIVDGEWCRVEEITSTYVVMRIWDQRRLIVPLNFFIENTFQNWTRTSAEILGTVFLWVDYTVPVEEIRQELHRLLQETELWDKRAWGLQVTDATERTVQIRALMSSADASAAWDLRCMVREKLIEFIQQRYPGALPRVRADFGDGEFFKRHGIAVQATSN